MATSRLGIEVQNTISEFSLNILPIFQGNIVESSGTNASISYNNTFGYEFDKCIEITFLNNGDVDKTIFYISDYSTVIPEDGSYILSYRFYKTSETANNDFYLNLYVNGLLVDGNVIEQNIDNAYDGLSYWRCFAQSFIFNEGDVITMTFEASTDDILEKLRLGGLKLEKNSPKLFGIPSDFSMPKDYCCSVDAISTVTGHASYTDSGYTSGAPFTIPATTNTVLPNRAQVIYDEQKPNDIKTFYYSRRLIISSASDDFLEGETITGGTSGATGTLIEINDDGDLLLVNQSGTWSASETITGGTSGSTATLDTIKQGAITGRNGDGLQIMLYFYAVPTNSTQTMDIWLDLTDGTGTPTNLSVLYLETYSFPKGVGVARGIKFNFASAYTRDTWQANGGRVFINSSHSLDIYGINFNLTRSHKAR